MARKLCCAVVRSSDAYAAPGASLKVGIAETPITPSWTVEQWGYNPRQSVGIQDDIFAKAFLFDWGKRFLIIMTEVSGIALSQRRRIGARIARLRHCRRRDYDPVHSRSLRAFLAGHASLDHRPALREALRGPPDRGRAAGTTRSRTAVLYFGQSESFIGLNRRVGDRTSTWNKESGPIDSVLNVLHVQAPDGRNRGIIVNYAAHLVTLRTEDCLISTDFPGALYKDLGSSEKCPVAFMQGCCGDMIPKVFGTTREMEEFGHKMADEARRALATAKPVTGNSLDYSSAGVTLTFVAPFTLDEMRANYGKLTKGVSLEHEHRAERMFRYLEDGGDIRQSRDTIVQAVRFGDMAMAVLPGEILHLTAVLIQKEFPQRRNLIVAAYSNDTSMGYLAPRRRVSTRQIRSGHCVDGVWHAANHS
jgi:hypothetical protein